jgi:hypothetical protein
LLACRERIRLELLAGNELDSEYSRSAKESLYVSGRMFKS